MVYRSGSSPCLRVNTEVALTARSGYLSDLRFLTISAALCLAAGPAFAGGGGGTLAAPLILDDGAGTASATQLHASWLFSNASTITEYRYEIRQDSTSGPIITKWVSSGTATSVTRTGLVLTYGKTYFFSVRGKDRTTGWSASAYSDGIRVNRPPTVAVTGPAQVDGGLSVRLDATGSQDPDGDPLQYSWRQTVGPAVQLSSTASAAPTFESPFVRPEDMVQFQVTVSDGIASASGSLDVTVAEAPLPSVDLQVSATTVQVGQPFTLTTLGNAAVGVQAVWWYGIDTGVTDANVVLNLPATPTSSEIFTTPFTNPVKLDRAFGSPRFSSSPRVTSYTFTSDVTINQPGVFRFGANSRDVMEGQPADATGHPTVTVTVQSSDPAQILYPQANQIVGGDTVSVQGTASIVGFERYELHFGNGAAPTSWSLIRSSTTPVVGGSLGTLSLVNKNQSQLTLRLRLFYGGGQMIERFTTFRPLELYSVTLNLQYLSPNGDGVQETATFSAGATQPVNWTLSFVSSTAQTVRTYSGIGTAVSVVWDGKDQGGQVVPDGRYTAVLHAVEPTSGLEDSNASRTTTVDITLPTATITSPTAGPVFDTVSVLGTASDANLFFYFVEYGVGTSPTIWPSIFTGASNVTAGTLASWDTRPRADGAHVLRLRVQDRAGNISTASVPLIIDNLVTGITVVPGVFDPSAAETAAIRYTLTRPATVTVRLYQSVTKTLARTLVNASTRSAGVQNEAWNGRWDNNAISPEAYYFTISATDGASITRTYNNAATPIPGPATAHSGYTVSSTAFDPFRNDRITIGFTMNQPGRLTLRITPSTSDTATALKTLLQSVPLADGAHTVFWDGRKDNGDFHQGNFAVFWDVPQLLEAKPIVVRSSRLEAQSLRLEPYVIQPVFGEVAAITYSLNLAAQVSVTIQDPNGNHFRTLVSAQSQAAGVQSLEWNGLNDAGRSPSMLGDYAVKITATDPATGLSVERTGAVMVYR